MAAVFGIVPSQTGARSRAVDHPCPVVSLAAILAQHGKSSLFADEYCLRYHLWNIIGHSSEQVCACHASYDHSQVNLPELPRTREWPLIHASCNWKHPEWVERMPHSRAESYIDANKTMLRRMTSPRRVPLVDLGPEKTAMQNRFDVHLGPYRAIPGCWETCVPRYTDLEIKTQTEPYQKVCMWSRSLHATSSLEERNHPTARWLG